LVSVAAGLARLMVTPMVEIPGTLTMPLDLRTVHQLFQT